MSTRSASPLHRGKKYCQWANSTEANSHGYFFDSHRNRNRNRNILFPPLNKGLFNTKWRYSNSDSSWRYVKNSNISYELWKLRNTDEYNDAVSNRSPTRPIRKSKDIAKERIRSCLC